jgi:hypothetical protein
VIDGFVHDDTGAEVSLEHRARRLAGSETGDPRTPGERLDGMLERTVETIGRQLDLEAHGRAGGWASGDLHRPEV